MNWRYYAAISLLLSAATARPARSDEIAKSPAFTTVAELSSGFHSLYTQNFMEAREKFDGWEIYLRSFTARVCSRAISS